jgi:hypothetical protein
MSRLTAWMATRLRRGSLRARRAAAPSNRPLGFERYELRIALSTNSAWLVIGYGVPVDGGFIELSSTGLKAASTTLTADVFVSRQNAIDAHLNTYSPANFGLYHQGGADLDAAVIDFQGAGWSVAPPEVLVVDSRVVPIPPPAVEMPGNEGGHISLAPFTGPSMLGLTPSNESKFAQSRPALAPPDNGDNSSTGPNLSTGDSLQGRAIVYEVAHAELEIPVESRQGAIDSRESLQVSLETPMAPLAAQQEAAASADQAQSRAAAHPASAAAFGTVVRQSAAAIHAIHTPGGIGPLHQAVAQGDSHSVVSQSQAALDAALEQWNSAADGEPRDALAATVDGHQRRLIGGVLIAVAAVPAAKAVRRARHHSAEERPRKNRW